MGVRVMLKVQHDVVIRVHLTRGVNDVHRDHK